MTLTSKLPLNRWDTLQGLLCMVLVIPSRGGGKNEHICGCTNITKAYPRALEQCRPYNLASWMSSP